MTDHRILVAFGTMTGSTREVAEAIGAELRQAGCTVDVKRADEVRKVADYGAVVIGTPVTGGMLNGRVKAFVRRNRKALAGMPAAFFVVCGAMSDPKPENRAMAEKYLVKARALAPDVKPVDTAIFGGAVKADGPDFARLNFIFRAVVKKLAQSPETMKDGRDWNAIRAWARQLGPKLVAR